MSKPKKPPALSPQLRRAINDAAKKAAIEAVEAVMIRLGINTETGEALIMAQDDMRFVRKLRLSTETTGQQYKLLGVGTLLTIFGSLATLGVQSLLQFLFTSGKVP